MRTYGENLGTARRLFAVVLASALRALGPTVSQAQPRSGGESFASRPLNLIVTFAPGGSTDIVGRLIAQKLGEQLNQTVVVLNKPGASGSIGVSELVRAPADGQTLLVNIVTTAVINSMTLPSVPYDPVKDLQPVALVGMLPNVVIINKNIPASNLGEFVTWARAHPDKATFGTGGPGGVQHLTGELLGDLLGFTWTHVPYKGAAPAIQDLLGGNISAVIDNVTGPMSFIKSGQVRALGVTTNQRVAELPDVPTLNEAGAKGFSNSSWISVFTRSGVPDAVLRKLQAAVLAAARDPEFQDKLRELGAIPTLMTTEELTGFWLAEFPYWVQAGKSAKLQGKQP